MRELNFGEQTVRVKATPLALLFYKQEFSSDILGDLVKMQEIANDPSKLDSVMILQLTWAMSKAAEGGKGFPSFYTWVENLESVDFSKEVMLGILEEAASGFFRGKQIQGQSAGRKKR